MIQVIKNTKSNKILNVFRITFALIFMVVFSSCEENTLPEAGSIPDLTPPSAVFSASQGSGTPGAWKVYSFSNQSSSATSYAWDFGDGSSSTDFEPTHTYAGEGNWTITLTAKDNLGVTSTFTLDINVEEPPAPAAIVPVIINPSFDEPGSDGKYTMPWVDGNMGKTMQISSSSSFVGGKASKFPNGNTNKRIGYQKDIAVTANTDYVITYYYSIETGGASSITLAVLGGTVTSPDDVSAATLQSFTGTHQGGKSDFQKVDLEFNSGNNASISIHISNTGEKTAYLEEITAKIK